MYKTLLLFLLLYFTTNSQIDGQNKSTIEMGKEQKEIDKLNNLAFEYLAIDLDSSYLFAEKAFKKSEKKDYYLGYIDACFAMGSYHLYKGEFKEAKERYQSAFDKAKNRNDHGKMAKAMGNIGNAEQFSTSYKEAIKMFDKALDLFKIAKDSIGVGKTLNNIGALYLRYGEFDAALSNFKEASNWFKLVNNDILYFSAISNIGSVLVEEKKYDEALTYLLKAKAFYDNKNQLEIGKSNIISSQTILASNLAIAYEGIKQYEKAKFYYKQAITFAEKNTNRRLIGSSSINIGILNYKQMQLDSAEFFILEGLKVSNSKDKYLENIQLANEYLILIYKEKGDFQKALKASEAMAEVKTEIFTGEKTEAVNDLKIKYESEKLKQEKLIIQGEQKITELNNKKLLFGLFVFLILTPFIIWFAYRENKRKRNETLLNEQLTKKNKEVEQANASLSQKNQEILHRAKNHLTMLSVFMKQEARRVDDPKAKSALLETENRLQAISLIDRKLNSNQGVEIAIKEYLEELTTYIKQTFPENGKALTLKTNLASIMVNPEEAVWIGLIINELMTNSYKYAFKNTTNPEIEISLNQEENNKLKMNYRDNGSGIVQPINEQYTKSFGQQLIHNFTEQMNGQLDIFNNKGLIYDFQFNLLTIK